MVDDDTPDEEDGLQLGYQHQEYQHQIDEEEHQQGVQHERCDWNYVMDEIR